MADANVYVRSLNKLNPSIAIDMDRCAAANNRGLHSFGGHYNIRLFEFKPPEETKKFHELSTPLLGVRRTVKSPTSIIAVVAGSSHSNKKSLSTELRRYQGFGVDVTLLQLGFDVTDFNSLPLITNDLME